MPDTRSASLDVALAGMHAIGLPAATLEHITGLPKVAGEASLIASHHWNRLWAWAKKHDAQPLLAARVALAIPFGAFGVLDYFVATAPMLHAALHDLQGIFPAVSDGTRLTLCPR